MYKNNFEFVEFEGQQAANIRPAMIYSKKFVTAGQDGHPANLEITTFCRNFFFD